MKPTRRGWGLAGLALGCYFFANQTQVGWLYVLSALAAALLLATWGLPHRMLRGLRPSRLVNGAALAVEPNPAAGDSLTVTLTLTNTGRLPALQVTGVETCAPAPAADRTLPLFIPFLATGQAAPLTYAVTCARRGWFPFGPVRLASRAPFGFWAAQRLAPVEGPEGVLIFPETRPLTRLDLFDRAPAVEASLARAGVGGEFLGVREYRPGDPPRHVHWRTTARAGRLVVREFAEEQQPALTLALDLSAAARLGGEDDNTLELGIKLAASLARHAHERGLPVTLLTNNPAWPAPAGPVSEWALLNYLARVEAGGSESLGDALLRVSAGTFVAAVLPAPDPDTLAPLAGLRQRALGVLAVLVDPHPFTGDGGLGIEARRLAGDLEAAGVAVRLIGASPHWDKALTDGEAREAQA
ncbi:MAG: DUF58 domain-containing protein [Anaerolineales bacterium]|nr:DUF58 domain-containing protein [Anaerolineales bacterium]